jgi:type IV secretory pathway TrbD component
MSNIGLRFHPIHKSMLRATSFMGVDRELGLFLGLLVFALDFVAFSVLKLVISIVLWFVGMAGLRMMAKKDLMLRVLAMRYFFRYTKVMAARSTAWRQNGQAQVNGYRTPA